MSGRTGARSNPDPDSTIRLCSPDQASKARPSRHSWEVRGLSPRTSRPPSISAVSAGFVRAIAMHASCCGSNVACKPRSAGFGFKSEHDSDDNHDAQPALHGSLVMSSSTRETSDPRSETPSHEQHAAAKAARHWVHQLARTIKTCRLYDSPSNSVIERSRLELATELQRRSEEHTSELQSRVDLVCRLLLEKKKTTKRHQTQGEVGHQSVGGRERQPSQAVGE